MEVKKDICPNCKGEFIDGGENSAWNKGECVWCNEWENDDGTIATNEERENERSPKKKFYVTIERSQSKTFEVEAKDEEEAEALVMESYENNKIKFNNTNIIEAGVLVPVEEEKPDYKVYKLKK